MHPVRILSSCFNDFVSIALAKRAKAPAGMQLGIFEGKGPIHEIGHIKTFSENIQSMNTFSDPIVEEILWEIHKHRWSEDQ